MTDEELIAMARLAQRDERMSTGALYGDLADRIAALVKEKERLGREVNTARYGQPDFAWSIHNQAMVDLQARAERLEAALNEVDALDPEGMIDGCAQTALRGLVLRMGEIARAALKGDGHE